MSNVRGKIGWLLYKERKKKKEGRKEGRKEKRIEEKTKRQESRQAETSKCWGGCGEIGTLVGI